MDLESSSSENKNARNSFFSIKGSTIVLDSNGEKVNLKLDQITNVRLIKNRNLSLNLILFYLSIVFYFIYIFFLKKHLFVQLTALLIVTALIIASISIKRFSYKLLVNKGIDGFNEFLVSKTNLPFAESFVSIFKKQKKQIESNHRRVFNYVS
jgi:hypothetical protein